MYVFAAAVLLACGSIFIYDVIAIEERLDDNHHGNGHAHMSRRKVPDSIPRETDVGDPSDVITHVKPVNKMIVLASQKPPLQSSGQKPKGKQRVVRDRPAADNSDGEEDKQRVVRDHPAADNSDGEDDKQRVVRDHPAADNSDGEDDKQRVVRDRPAADNSDGEDDKQRVVRDRLAADNSDGEDDKQRVVRDHPAADNSDGEVEEEIRQFLDQDDN